MRKPGSLSERVGASALDVQHLRADCAFPLVTGTTGPVLRRLTGSASQRLLDEDDVERVSMLSDVVSEPKGGS